MAELGLTKKLGPLPVWAWGILGGVAVYFLYTRYKHSSGSSATATGPVASVLDPNAIDPATGLTYGSELSGSYPSQGSLGATGASVALPSGGTVSLGDLATLSTLFNPPAPASPSDVTAPFTADTSPQVAAAAASPALTPPAGPGAPGSARLGGTYGLAVGSKIGSALAAPSGPHKPPAPPGYRAVGIGAGNWLFVQGPQTHMQKTVHVAHPAPHQQPVTHKNSTPRRRAVTAPAGGGRPGHPASGAHHTGSSASHPTPPPPRRITRPRPPAARKKRR